MNISLHLPICEQRGKLHKRLILEESWDAGMILTMVKHFSVYIKCINLFNSPTTL